MRFPLWRRRREEELEEEIRSHLEMAKRDRIERGETDEDAQMSVRREFGNALLIKEVTRDMWGWTSLERLGEDLRYGTRMLMKNPGFTAVAVITLALGIGATTAIFSVVYATLFESMPYPNPDQLVMVWSSMNQRHNSVSAGDYLEWKRRSNSFQYLEAWSGGTSNVA